MELTPKPTFYDYDDQYFDAGIRGWHSTSFKPITELFEKCVGAEPLGDVLDFGCGDGFYGPFLKKRAKELDGVDYSDAAFGSQFRGAYRDVYQADLGIPWDRLPEKSYDSLFSTEVVEHIVDYREFFANAFRLLRPNGRLIFTTTTYTFTLFIMLMAYRRQVGIRSLTEFFRGYWNYAQRSKFVERFAPYTGGHHHGFTKRQLHTALRSVGFRIEQSKFLFAQDAVHTKHLDQPYTGPYRIVVKAGIPLIRFAGNSINWFYRTTKMYAPNVMIVARRPG